MVHYFGYRHIRQGSNPMPTVHNQEITGKILLFPANSCRLTVKPTH